MYLKLVWFAAFDDVAVEKMRRERRTRCDKFRSTIEFMIRLKKKKDGNDNGRRMKCQPVTRGSFNVVLGRIDVVFRFLYGPTNAQ